MRNFHGNDILGNYLAGIQHLYYNALQACKKTWREEYKTFRDWFVKIPAKVVSSARNIYVKMSKYYHAAHRWS
ncbi:MAG: hypothetical protein IPN86_14870 [Saprospiraceae bacterium]|nr:hypothetical protein [Saprospiraceae bacterium]